MDTRKQSLSARATDAAKHAIRAGLADDEAQAYALAGASDLDAHQRRIYLTIWRERYHARRAQEAINRILTDATLWE